MKQKGIVQNKSQKERLSFYAEIGKYFSPDGNFYENSFRIMLRETLGKMKKSSAGEDTDDYLNQWLSLYLTEVIDYLIAKDLIDAAFSLIKAAIDEAETFGLENVSVSATQIKQLMKEIPVFSKKDDRKKKSSDEMKLRIFAAAVEVFGSKGYYRSTIDDIVTLSGVGKGSVYRHFKSKEELLIKLLEEKYEEIAAALNEVFLRDIDVLQQLQEMIKTWLSFIEKNHVVYRLIQMEAVNPDRSGSLMFYDYIINHFPMLKEHIIALNKEKKIKVANFATVFYGILGFVDGVAHKWYHSNMSYPLSDELPVILEVLFNGFIIESESGKQFYSPDGKNL